MATHRLTGYMA